MAEEKKDDPDAEKGDKGRDAGHKAREQADHTPGQKGIEGEHTRGGHRKRTGGNPDGSN